MLKLETEKHMTRSRGEKKPKIQKSGQNQSQTAPGVPPLLQLVKLGRSHPPPLPRGANPPSQAGKGPDPPEKLVDQVLNPPRKGDAPPRNRGRNSYLKIHIEVPGNYRQSLVISLKKT